MNVRGCILFGSTLLLLPVFLLAQETPEPPTFPAYADSVYINEFLPDPSSAQGPDSEAEFVELYNDSDEEVDISGWIVDTGGSDVPAIPAGTTIGPRGFLVFFSGDDNPDLRIALANAGDTIKLFRPDHTLQDEVTYTSSQAGYSYNRVEAGMYLQGVINTPGEANVFPTPTPSATPSPTPTMTPTPAATASVSPTTPPSSVPYSSSVHINEFLPNPKGDDATLEFIELFNSSGEEVDISGWIIDTGSSSSFKISDGVTLGANGYMALYRATTKISLNNLGNHRVRLLDPSGSVRGDVPYSGSKEGYSYNRVSDGSYHQSSTPTPNGENIITAIEEPTPTPDADGEDDERSVAGVLDASYEYSSKIIINEFLPNPVGLDTEQEFIEIKNMDTKTIALAGWKLDDGEGGSSPHAFSEEDTLGPGAIAVFFRSATKIALNNDADDVRLIDPSGKIVDTVSYAPPVPEGQSYARDVQNRFVWSQEVTPDEENTIHVQGEEEQEQSSSKPQQAKKAASGSRVARAPSSPSVSAAARPFLAWPEVDEGVVTRTIIGAEGGAAQEKRKLFVIFGSIAAIGQFVSGILSKERIWHKG